MVRSKYRLPFRRTLWARSLWWLTLSGCSGLGSNLGMHSDEGQTSCSAASHWEEIKTRLENDQKISLQEVINLCKFYCKSWNEFDRCDIFWVCSSYAYKASLEELKALFEALEHENELRKAFEYEDKQIICAMCLSYVSKASLEEVKALFETLERENKFGKTLRERINYVCFNIECEKLNSLCSTTYFPKWCSLRELFETLDPENKFEKALRERAKYLCFSRGSECEKFKCLLKFLRKKELSYREENQDCFNKLRYFVYDRKCDVNKCFWKGAAVLTSNIAQGRNISSLSTLFLLQDLKADPFVSRDSVKNALHLLLLKGDPVQQCTVVEKVLQHPNIRDHINDVTKGGDTALHIACARKDINNIRKLLQNGASGSLEIENEKGERPVDMLYMGKEARLAFLSSYLVNGYGEEYGNDLKDVATIDDALFNADPDAIKSEIEKWIASKA